MRPANSKSRWFAAAACVLATSFANAEEAVVRITDADKDTGVVRMNAGQTQAPVKPRYFAPPNARNYYQSNAYSPQQHFAAYAQYYGLNQGSGIMQTSGEYPGGYSLQAPQQPGYSQVAYTPQVCSDCNSGLYMGDAGGWGHGSSSMGCDAVNGSCDNCYGSCDSCDTNCDSGSCDDCYGHGYRSRLRLLAGAVPKDCSNRRWPCRWWRGQQANYHARNQRLANHLFGWMIPSGCCGQGCPPVGCYGITYADDPGYADSRDAQQYGVQGYGTPMTVPLAPNVRYSYNYSWGTPSSRLTPVGSYDPQTSPQQLYRPTF